MSKINKLLAALTISGGLVFVAGTAQAQNTVAFDQDVYNVSLDETFTVQLDGIDFERVNGGGVNISWDPDVLQIVFTGDDASVIDPLWELNVTGDASVPGQLDGLLFATFNNNPEGSFGIADITFSAIGNIGDSTSFMLSESSTNPFGGPDGSIPGLNFSTATVNVVPEMEVWAMMLAGMGFLGWQARRRLQQNTLDDALPG